MLTSETNLKEEIVIEWLHKHGYFRTATITSGSHKYIEGDAERRRILVMVVSQDEYKQYSDIEEFDHMSIIASESNRECWKAVVPLDQSNKLIGDISWENLSRK